eukprot:GHVP01014750.1.p2 GENE.GHVP01014750.1~~GHVP01014750.1.p2  ORF type:complete len:113 (+),score=20.49 GHVP01014750.1:34-372(+)
MLIPGASTFFQIQKDHEAIAFLQPDFTAEASKQNHPITKSVSPHSPSGYTIPEDLIFLIKIVAGASAFFACSIATFILYIFHDKARIYRENKKLNELEAVTPMSEPIADGDF